MNDVAVIQTPSGELRISYQEAWDALKQSLRKRRREVRALKGMASLITERHEDELKAMVEAMKDDPMALAKNVFVLGVLVAGEVKGVAKALDCLKKGCCGEV